MKIIPAIDIKNGKCVRLYQGDFEKVTIYENDPVAVAKKWEKLGAKKLHIVDLDGAKDGSMKNFETIKKIVNAVTIPVQVGGGIRTEKTIKALQKIGIKKIILGTIVLENKIAFKKLFQRYKDTIIVSLDVANNTLVTRGWKKRSKKSIKEIIDLLNDMRMKEIIYTDTLRDGTMTSPNFSQISSLVEKCKEKPIIAGGISSYADIERLEKIGIENVIVGKALYEGSIKIC